MDEHVLAPAFDLDKAEALLRVEPLHSAGFRHGQSSSRSPETLDLGLGPAVLPSSALLVGLSNPRRRLISQPQRLEAGGFPANSVALDLDDGLRLPVRPLELLEPRLCL